MKEKLKKIRDKHLELLNELDELLDKEHKEMVKPMGTAPIDPPPPDKPAHP